MRIGVRILTIGVSYSKPGPAIRGIFASLAALDCLEFLSIRGWKQPVVPEGIRELQHLKDLSLTRLGLTSIPDWVGGLNLETFSALYNKLTAVPDTLRNLKRLRSLDLSWNPLVKVSECTFELVSLESLYLRDCGIREIPADILRLTHLKWFAIENNNHRQKRDPVPGSAVQINVAFGEGQLRARVRQIAQARPLSQRRRSQ